MINCDIGLCDIPVPIRNVLRILNPPLSRGGRIVSYDIMSDLFYLDCNISSTFL
jgi:hypothetical protein